MPWYFWLWLALVVWVIVAAVIRANRKINEMVRRSTDDDSGQGTN
jgi:hypothetical protein